MPEWTPRTVDLETDHEYDGIREFDNPLPRWWLLTFWGTIIFSVFYWFHFHNRADTPGTYVVFAQELAEVMPAPDKDEGITDDDLLAMVQDGGAVAAGRTHYETYCMACHGPKGEGALAPNLTDAYWMHGDSPTAIHQTVAAGIPAKGMAAWAPALGGRRVKEVVAYLLSIKDTHIAGKEPQGVDAAGEAP